MTPLIKIDGLWINPDRIALIQAGDNGTTIVHLGDTLRACVIGTPDDVVAQLQEAVTPEC